MINGIEGGISAPSVPPAANAPVAKDAEYLYRRNSGSDTCPIIAAVASEEPLMVPKAAQPPIAAIAKPPRKWPMKALAARNRAWVTPARLAKLPIIRNSGITEKSNELNRQYASVLRKLRSDTTSAIVAKPTIPTAIMATPIGTRRAMSRKSAPNPTPPMARSLIASFSLGQRRGCRSADVHVGEVFKKAVENRKYENRHAEQVERKRPPPVKRKCCDLLGRLPQLQHAVIEPTREHDRGAEKQQVPCRIERALDSGCCALGEEVGDHVAAFQLAIGKKREYRAAAQDADDIVVARDRRREQVTSGHAEGHQSGHSATQDSAEYREHPCDAMKVPANSTGWPGCHVRLLGHRPPRCRSSLVARCASSRISLRVLRLRPGSWRRRRRRHPAAS